VTLSQQVIELLSTLTGNLIYHVITLASALVVMGVGWWQYRRNKTDSWAWRLAGAGAGILLTRVIMIIAFLSLNATADATLAASILPPLEQALHTVVVILVVWAVMPAFSPHLDAVMLTGLLITAVLYTFFGIEWYGNVNAGSVTAYNNEAQNNIWTIFQIIVLGIGTIGFIVSRGVDKWLRVLIVATLFLAHFAHLANPTTSFIVQNEIPYWLRLGQLIALPLLAIFSYRYLLRELLYEQLQNRPPREQIAETLQASTQILAQIEENGALAEAVAFAGKFTTAHFSAIALTDSAHANQLRVVSREESGDMRHWRLNLTDWNAFVSAMERGSAVELMADGVGAKQLHDLYQELNVVGGGPLLIEPLMANNKAVGVLLLAGQVNEPCWSPPERGLTPFIARHVAHILTARAVPLSESDPIVPATIATIREARAEIETELEQVQARLKEREATLQHVRQSALAQVKTVTEKLEEREEALAMLQQENAGIQTQHAKLSSQLENIQSEREQLTAKLRATETKLRQNENRVRTLKDNLGKLDSEHSQQTKQIATLNKAIATLTADRDQWQAKSKRGANNLASQLAETEAALVEANTALARSTEELAALEVNSMVAQIGNDSALIGEHNPALQLLRIAELESETASLREALVEAEEAMAMATAESQGLSHDWVLKTISRYSGELESAQAKILQLEVELARANGTQAYEMILKLAQELRTPMTAMTSYTELLLTESAGIIVPKQRNFLEKVRDNVAKMAMLLGQIVETSKPQSKRNESQISDTNLLLQEAIEAVKNQAAHKAVRLNLNIEEKLPALSMNRDDFYQIALQLLNNAVLASTEKGNVVLEADVEGIENAGTSDTPFQFLRLVVSDSGVGIPATHRAQIFTPQLDPDASPIVGLGEAGIGLATAHALVTEHGGRIWVDSETNIGSRFTVLLPTATINGQS
jgi:signal transduction histidine kinase